MFLSGSWRAARIISSSKKKGVVCSSLCRFDRNDLSTCCVSFCLRKPGDGIYAREGDQVKWGKRVQSAEGAPF